MNREMWAHPATQRNFAQLRADGATVLGPGSGDQACGEIGDGRMLEPAELLDELIAFFQPKLLAGKRVLVTAGPTFEPIDPVRGLTNRSSGKMGFAIARAAAEAGADVTLVAGPVALDTPRHVRRVDVTTAAEMHAAVMAAAPASDVFVATAAVADWRVAEVAEREDQEEGRAGRADASTLVENVDILAAVAALPKAPFCVGFAAESGDVLANASAKRLKKNVPLIVGNLGPATFGQDDNALTLVDARGVRELPRAGKLALARQLVAEIAARLAHERRHERRTQREDARRRAHPRSAHRRSAAGLRHRRQRRPRPARLHRRAAGPRARRRRAGADRPRRSTSAIPASRRCCCRARASATSTASSSATWSA